MDTAEFIAKADWAWVRAGVLEHRAECETSIAQIDAEVRLAGRMPQLREQEKLARMQANLDAVDHLLAVLERQGV